MNCNVCGRNMVGKDGTEITGISIKLEGSDEVGKKRITEIYPEFPDGIFINVCFVCWIKSLGIKI